MLDRGRAGRMLEREGGGVAYLGQVVRLKKGRAEKSYEHRRIK